MPDRHLGNLPSICIDLHNPQGLCKGDSPGVQSAMVQMIAQVSACALGTLKLLECMGSPPPRPGFAKRLWKCATMQSMHAYIHTHMHTYRPTYIHTYMHTHIRTQIHSCIHTCIHTLHTYIHTYTHTHTHTHQHTHIAIQEKLIVLLWRSRNGSLGAARSDRPGRDKISAQAARQSGAGS